VPERTPGGLFLPDEAALMDDVPVLPAFAKPVEPGGDGLLIDSGFSSGYLVTDPEHWLAILEQPRLFIQDRALDVADLIEPLEVAAHKASPIVVIAPALTVRARAFVIINKLRGTIQASAIETQRTAEILAYSSRHAHIRLVTSGVRTSLIE
jgi:hypothetical protein